MKKTITIIFITFTLSLFSQTQEQIKLIIKDYDLEHLNALSKELSHQNKAKKEYAIKMAKINNWPITIKTQYKLSELVEVVNGYPIYISTSNIDAAESTRTNTLHNNGLLGLNLEGQNMTAYVWDSGKARLTHQEYDGIGGNDRYSVGDGTNTHHFHAAHVTGTIMASGFINNAKGMAPQCNVIGFDWHNDDGEVATQLQNGMLVSNHSYGAIANTIPDQWFGAYTSNSRNWDILMFNAPFYLKISAAGNDGQDSTSNGSPLDNNSGYDKLSMDACSKNGLVIANAQDATINTNGDLIAVAINNDSSQGPTDDYRIKPDLAGNGTQLYSTYEDADDSYASITGTSMAAPNITGTLLLLQQYYNEINGNFMTAATLKGLALHTADDAGTIGPDAVFGWGLMNAKKSAIAINQNNEESIIEELTLNNTNVYSTSVTSDGINRLTASISWTDPAGVVNNGLNSPTPALINDLDIRINKDGTTYYPYKLTSTLANTQGDNIVDPFERIDIDNAAGNYTITVSHKGNLTNGLQNFSLIITGLQFDGTCIANEPINPQASNIFLGSLDLNWDNVLGATYEVRYKLSSSDNWINITTNNEFLTIEGLSGTYNVQVRSVCTVEGTVSNWISFENTLGSVVLSVDNKYFFDKYVNVYSDSNKLNIIVTKDV